VKKGAAAPEVTYMTETRATPHWSLDLYLEYLRGFSPPEEPFDGEGEWEHSYVVYPVYAHLDVTGQAWSEKQQGLLRLTRRPFNAGGQLRLEVVSEVTFLDWLPTRTQRTSATITCHTDALASPTSWELDSVALAAEDGSPVPLSEMSESGTLDQGRVELTFEGGSRAFEVARHVTSNWSLFEALQRLPREMPPEAEFDMLEDLRLRRQKQRLFVEGATTVETAAGPLRLYGFRQLGAGISPTHYWLDEQGRVLLVLSKMRAYIWQDESSRRRGHEQ
jgi:hypothetical protein